MTNELKTALGFKAYFEPNGTLVQRDLDTIKTWQRNPAYQQALKNCRFRVKSFLGRPSHLVLEEKSTFSKFVGGLKNFFGIDSEKRAMEKRLVNTALSPFHVQGSHQPNIQRLCGAGTFYRPVYSAPYVSMYPPGQRLFIHPASQGGYAYGQAPYIQPVNNYPQNSAQPPHIPHAPQSGNGNSDTAKLDNSLQALEDEYLKKLMEGTQQPPTESKTPEEQSNEVHSSQRAKSAFVSDADEPLQSSHSESKNPTTSEIHTSKQSPTVKTGAKTDGAEVETADEKLKVVSEYVLKGLSEIGEALKNDPDQIAQKSKEFMTRFFEKTQGKNQKLLDSYLKGNASKAIGIYFSRLLMNTQKGKEWCSTENGTIFGQLLNKGLQDNSKEVDEYYASINQQIAAQQQFIHQLGQLTKTIKVAG